MKARLIAVCSRPPGRRGRPAVTKWAYESSEGPSAGQNGMLPHSPRRQLEGAKARSQPPGTLEVQKMFG